MGVKTGKHSASNPTLNIQERVLRIIQGDELAGAQPISKLTVQNLVHTYNVQSAKHTNKAWVISKFLNKFLNKLTQCCDPSTDLSSVQPLQLFLLGLPSDGSLDSSGQLGVQLFFCVGFLA